MDRDIPYEQRMQRVNEVISEVVTQHLLPVVLKLIKNKNSSSVFNDSTYTMKMISYIIVY